jgi:hypothetical protein
MFILKRACSKVPRSFYFILATYSLHIFKRDTHFEGQSRLHAYIYLDIWVLRRDKHVFCLTSSDTNNRAIIYTYFLPPAINSRS